MFPDTPSPLDEVSYFEYEIEAGEAIYISSEDEMIEFNPSGRRLDVSLNANSYLRRSATPDPVADYEIDSGEAVYTSSEDESIEFEPSGSDYQLYSPPIHSPPTPDAYRYQPYSPLIPLPPAPDAYLHQPYPSLVASPPDEDLYVRMDRMVRMNGVDESTVQIPYEYQMSIESETDEEFEYYEDELEREE